MLQTKFQLQRDMHDMVLMIARQKAQMKRMYKYDLGALLVGVSIECLTCIAAGNANMEHRLGYIYRFSEEFEKLKSLLGICVDLELFSSVKASADLSYQLAKIQKGMRAWEQDTKSRSHINDME